MSRQDQIDAAAEAGAALYYFTSDGRGNAPDPSDADLAKYGDDYERIDAFVYGFDEAKKENEDVSRTRRHKPHEREQARRLARGEY